jgi:hypothetical protein
MQPNDGGDDSTAEDNQEEYDCIAEVGVVVPPPVLAYGEDEAYEYDGFEL